RWQSLGFSQRRIARQIVWMALALAAHFHAAFRALGLTLVGPIQDAGTLGGSATTGVTSTQIRPRKQGDDDQQNYSAKQKSVPGRQAQDSGLMRLRARQLHRVDAVHG